MVINNNKTENKGKALYGFVGMLSFCALLALWPQPSGYSQPDSAPPKAMHQTVDSLAILRQRNDKQDSINLLEARSLTALTRNLNRKLRKRADIHHEAAKPTIVLRWNGNVYETDPEAYKNYLIIDIDSFLNEVDTGTYQVIDEFVDSPKVETIQIPKRTWLQKLFKK